MSNIHEVNFGNLHNIPAQIREIANMIERGDLGEVTGGVLVLNNNAYDVFGLGRSDDRESCFLMCVGQRKVTEVEPS